MKRYQEQIKLPSVGLEGQLKLKKARILVVGAGGLGCACLQYLASMGVGHIDIVDHDVVETSNLHRQVLYTDEDVGKSKAVQAAAYLKKMNPEGTFLAHPVQFKENLFRNHDLIIDAADNFSATYAISDTNKPFLFASIYQQQAQMALMKSSCYRCLFPRERSGCPTCEEVGVLGVLPGIVGATQALLAVRYLLGEGVEDILHVLDYNLFQWKTMQIATTSDHPHHEVDFLEIDKAGIEKLSEYQLIDVRTKEERAVSHFGGIHVPMDELESFFETQNKPAVLYCAKGIRSRYAANYLREKLGRSDIFYVQF